MKIILKGITRNTPGATCPDGELEELLNVRHKDGTFRPVPLRSVVLSDLPYTNIYIHTNSGYKHFLGVKEGSLYYFAYEVSGTITTISEVLICALSGFATFTQIGNVINIVDIDSIKHAVWYDNEYKYIDTSFDGLQTDTSLIGKIDFKVEPYVNGDNVRKTLNFYSDVEIPVSTTTEIKSASAVGLMMKALSFDNDKGRLTGYVLACSAIELYDGSVILHSNPVLLGQSYDTKTRYSNSDIAGYDYITNPLLYYSPGAVSYYNVTTNTDKYYEKDSETIIAGTAGTTGNNFLTSFFPNSFCSNYFLKFDGVGDVSKRMVCRKSSNLLKIKVVSSIPAIYKSLIKSVNVYITTQVIAQDYNTVEHKGDFDYNGVSANKSENYFAKPKTNDALVKEIGNLSTFYKVKSIPFDDIVVSSDSPTAIAIGTWIDVDLSNGILKNITAQETLPYDDFSHHAIVPKTQFVYNSKLHIGNCKTKLSHGFPVNYFHANMGVGQFQPNSFIDHNSEHELHYVEVSLKITDGISKMIRFTTSYLPFVDLNPMLSYPDTRAYKMVIYGYRLSADDGTTERYIKSEFTLKPSDVNNYAYYISPDLKPIQNIPNLENPTERVIHNEVNPIQTFSNITRVSEVNNPFIFPVENTYPVGNGEIIGFATNTIALSTGQAGQFPVYIFCTDGIYALYIGGSDVNYASSRPISREVCNNPFSIKAIDNGVLFTTDEGIKVISGSQVNDISEVLRGDFFNIDRAGMFKQAIDHKALVQLSTEATLESILSYISNAVVGYNKKGDYKELWFTNPAKSYSYVFAQGIWYKVKQTGQEFVNDYPKQYLLDSGSLIDLSSETGTGNETMFLTRPLKFGDQNFKRMITAVIRGYFNPENAYKTVEGVTTLDYERYIGIYIFGSYDCEHWQFLGGSEVKGERRDVGAVVERTDCKFFRIGFVGNISLNSTIDYIEIDGKESKMLSKKIR